jgi:hypothetical protein
VKKLPADPLSKKKCTVGGRWIGGCGELHNVGT